MIQVFMNYLFMHVLRIILFFQVMYNKSHAEWGWLQDNKNYWIIKQEVAPKIQKGKVWVLFTHAHTVWKGEWQMQSIYKGIYRQVIANENWS